jgi:hypothetical protein
LRRREEEGKGREAQGIAIGGSTLQEEGFKPFIVDNK